MFFITSNSPQSTKKAACNLRRLASNWCIISENHVKHKKTQKHSTPVAIDINTPNQSIVEDTVEENIQEGECKLSVDDQLSIVRKDNHTIIIF